MGSTRRMFSRRSIAGLLTGIILGFNLASWIALPVPSRTDIEIEVIAGERERGDGSKYPEFRVGAAFIRRNQVGIFKSGKDCDQEVVNYDVISKSNDEKDNSKLNDEFVDDNHDGEENQNNLNENQNLLREFEMEEERRKRQKELELFYESDVDEENKNWDDESEMLEDFQYPANAKKYVDYETEMTSQSDGRKEKKQRPNSKKQRNLIKPPQESASVPEAKTPHDRNHFIYVGVLTAQKYLATRGRAIMDTWGKQIPGKLEFYVGEGVKNIQDGGKPLPLVKLKTVKDDAYPPQKKSFLLLKNMYDAYLNSG